MKTCPSCRQQYEDDTLVFCLQDGARLLSEATSADPQATWQLPQAPLPPTQAARRVTTPGQSTITARPEQFQINQRQPTSSGTSSQARSSVLPWILAIVFMVGVSAVLIAWIVTRRRGDNVATPSASPTPGVMATASPVATAETDKSSVTAATPDRSTKEDKPTPTPRPTLERAKPAFTLMNNISFSGGSRITYYPRASVGQCQADCAGNPSCKAFTWIRPGAYNPGDSAMCYLMSSVTGPVSHPCCISAVKN